MDDNNYNPFDNESGEVKNDVSGEMKGFDDASSNDDGGFYTKSHSDIIQDEIDNDNFKSDNDSYNSDFSSSNYTDTVYGKSPYVNDSKRKPKREKKKYGAGAVILASVLAAVIGAVSGIVAFNYGNDSSNLSQSLPQVDGNSSGTSNVSINVDENMSSISQAVAAKCSKSVVGIRTTTSVQSFFGGTSESTGEGSGVVYTKDGYIITNYHVVENAISASSASKIEVFFDNASTTPYKASVVGYNVSCDLAVLKIDADNLSAVDVGSSSSLKVGQYVVTIGAPGGLEFMGSVTYGIISGLDRVVSSNSKIGLIQTDAAINPGNSGGALLDENGKLIGINSSKIVSEEFEGMGFAIPVNSVVEICNGIISNKDKAEPYVGITISEKYTSDVLESYGYPVGAVVLSVADGSNAEKCGIQKGDIITEFNGTEITEYNVFGKVLAKCEPGSSVSVKIYRSGRYYQTKITIGNTMG